jgi:hypothetical protein
MGAGARYDMIKAPRQAKTVALGALVGGVRNRLPLTTLF